MRRIWGSSSMTRMRPELNSASPLFNAALRRTLHRHCQSKRRFTRPAAHRQIAAMCLHDPMSNAQPQSGTRDLILNRSASIESLKNVRLFLGGDSRTAIRNFKTNCTIGKKSMNRDWTFGRRVLQGIIEKLLRCELDQASVERNRG